MVIAVTFENGNVYEHFGHANEVKLYTVENGEILETLTVVCDQINGHTAMADMLSAHDVAMLICGNIGAGALEALEERKIMVYPGVSGSADEAVQAFLKGELSFNPDTMCDHHDHAGEAGGGCGCSGGCGCAGGCAGGCGAGAEGITDEPIELPPIKDYEFSKPEGGVTELIFDEFDEQVTGHGYPIIINFGAPWCAPCKELDPRFEALSHEYTNIKFCHVDCDAESEIANYLQITSVPTMLIVKSNAIIDELIGAYPDDELRKALDRALALEL